MRFYTPAECEAWCRDRKIPLDDGQQPSREFVYQHTLRCDFPPSFTGFLPYSRCIESALQPRRGCLLWVTQSSIWPNSENNQLYYRWRQSYGDGRLIDEAPGHLCLDYEGSEVTTLVYLAMLFGWDLHLLPHDGYSQAFICHDEWLKIGFTDEQQFNEARTLMH